MSAHYIACAIAPVLTAVVPGVRLAQLDATDGNLSVYLRKLEEAGYVAIEKSFGAAGRPRR